MVMIKGTPARSQDLRPGGAVRGAGMLWLVMGCSSWWVAAQEW
jgi:hypothetical protein